MKKKIMILFILLFSAIYWTAAYSINLQNSLSSKVIRLHIIANSNSSFDQSLKLKVRDAIIKSLAPKLESSTSLTDSRNIISENLSFIETIAQSTIEPYTSDTVSAFMSNSKFPSKTYEDISFPAGTYESLKVVIGSGKGENWWCVMFPPLCFTDSSIKFDDESLATLKQNLSNEEYALISNLEKPDVKIKFKLLEWLNR